MPGPQTAIRQEDEITHSDALFGAVEGILVGLAVGALVGAAIVATGGLAVVAVGAVLVGGGIGGMFGKTIGRHSTHPKGKVLTGSPNVIVGNRDDAAHSAARALADVAHCDDHSDSEPAHDQPGILGKRIEQGSGTVLINGFHAAREGDQGSCGFTLGQGSATVFVGGPTVTVGKIDAEVPAFVDDLITGMAIVGTALMMWPGAVAMFSAGTAAGLGGSVLGVGANLLQVGLRLGAQVYVGMKLSEAGGVIGHGTAGFFGAADGSLASDLATLTGQTAAPFAGGGLYEGIAEAPLPGMEAPTAVPEGIADPAAPADGVQGGPTGARTEFSGTPEEQAQADAAYDRIRADDGDVGRIASNTGYSEDQIAAVKQHLFYDEHDIPVGDDQTGEIQTSSQRFTSDPWIADRWTKASDGTLGAPSQDALGTDIPGSADPTEASDFHSLISHEYVEQGLMADGAPYRSSASWGQGKSGWNFYPDAQNAGAHDLAPLAAPNGKDPFAHYDSMGRSADGIPRPNGDLSNLDEVLDAIRRSPGSDTPAGPSGSGGPEGGPQSGGSPGRGPPGEEPFVEPKPLPANPTEGIPPTPAADAAPLVLPDAAPGAEAGSGGGGGAAGETEAASSAPEPAHTPEAARTEPEPVPAAANSVPANPKYAGGPATIPRTNPSGGHLPADFGLHTISENPQELRLFRQALDNKATSPRTNDYQRYLEIIRRGETPTQAQAEKAWGSVQQEYFAVSRDAGTNMDDVEIHHWNYSKGEYPLQVTDPQNLVQTPDRQTSWNSHQAIHEATSSDPNTAIGKWKGPIDAIHELPITPAPPIAPDLNP